MEVKVIQDDITSLDVEAIVNPANSRLVMGGGLAGVIKKKGGSSIEEKARSNAPVPVGKAVKTSSGDLPSRFVIHAPTMENPAEKISKENVRKAMRGVLNCAVENGIEQVAVPGLGTGVGGVPTEEAASAMMDELEKYVDSEIEEVIFVGFEDELFQAFSDERKRRFG